MLTSYVPGPTLIKEFILSSTLTFLIAFFLISGIAKAFVNRSHFMVRLTTWVCLLVTMGFMITSETSRRSQDNYLTLFGLKREFNLKDFKRACKIKKMEYHPDRASTSDLGLTQERAEQKYQLVIDLCKEIQGYSEPKVLWELHVSYGSEIDILNPKMVEAELKESVTWVSEIIAACMNYLLVVLLTYMFFMSVPILNFWHKIGITWVVMAYLGFEFYALLSLEIDNPELDKVYKSLSEINEAYSILQYIQKLTNEEIRFFSQSFFSSLIIAIYSWILLNFNENREELMYKLKLLTINYQKTFRIINDKVDQEIFDKVDGKNSKEARKIKVKMAKDAQVDQQVLDDCLEKSRGLFKDVRREIREYYKSLGGKKTSTPFIQTVATYFQYGILLYFLGLKIYKMDIDWSRHYKEYVTDFFTDVDL